MASSDQNDTVFADEDIDNDDEESHDDLLQDDDEEDEEELYDDVLPNADENDPSPSTSSAVAVTIAVAPPISPATTASDSKRNQIEEKKPIDDSRKLFQRLWTDEDEIELLQGFLDYTSNRGSSHHNDTALFYDQIKSRFQIDFNKNQLVEKIRRLKKKYRNVVSKINSGKEFSFKSPHDQATFEISRKIWSNIGQISGGFVVDDKVLNEDEINLNSNQNPNNHYPNHNPNINLNLVQSTPKNEVVMLGNSGEKKFTPSRKRSRPRSAMMSIDEKPQILFNDGLGSGLGLNLNKDHNCIMNSNSAAANVNNDKNYENNCNNEQQHSNSIPGLVEESVRSCLTPMLKELMGGGVMGGGLFGARGFGLLNSMQMPMVTPLSFSGFGSSGDVVDEKWRKQQILELEVYAKRLELVQDQIKAALGELRSAGG